MQLAPRAEKPLTRSPEITASARVSYSARDAHQNRLFAAGLIDLTPMLGRYARSLSRSSDEAEDLLQDTLLRAWRTRDSFDPVRDLRPWLATIKRNRFYDVIVANRKTLQDVDGIHAARLTVPPTQLFKLEVEGVVLAIDALPKLYREAMYVLLRGLGYEAAAALIDCPVSTFKSRVQRARRMLQKGSELHH